MKFSINDFLSKFDQIHRKQFPASLMTFTEEILNGKLHFLCSANSYVHPVKTWNLTTESLINLVELVKDFVLILC